VTTEAPATPTSGTTRAAQTKRNRTRQLILSAIDDLLGTRPYDDIRIADIAGHAGVGVATFYTVFGDKGGAVGELFVSLYKPLEQQAQLDIETARTSTDVLLGAHFLRLARLVHDHRPLTRGFLRAYGSDVFAKAGDPVDNNILKVSSIAQRLIDDMANADPVKHRRLWVADLGTYWTVELMLAVISHCPDDHQRIAESLLMTYLPTTNLDETNRIGGIVTSISQREESCRALRTSK